MPSHFHGWVVNMRLLMYLVLIGILKKKREFGEIFGGRGSLLGVS